MRECGKTREIIDALSDDAIPEEWIEVMRANLPVMHDRVWIDKSILEKLLAHIDMLNVKIEEWRYAGR